MNADADTRTTRRDAEWVVRQGFACVWVKATSPQAGIKIAAKRLEHIGGRKVPRGVAGHDVASRRYAVL